ncbi:MAG: hypothetical protein DI625_12565 [Sphingomonas sp.]|jgi:hypothetical protein|nr:MAG: hypothetical protein DI625_12565 [Sphingomonas sp.]
MFGSHSDIKRLKLNPKAVVVPVDVPFLVVVETMGMFLTHGPVGGSKLPYQLIEWAYKNAPAFGVSISVKNGMNMPVIWLANNAEVTRAVAALNVPACESEDKA